MVGRNVDRITVDICIQQLGRVEIILLPYDAGLSAAAETLVRNPEESDCQSRRLFAFS